MVGSGSFPTDAAEWDFSDSLGSPRAAQDRDPTGSPTPDTTAGLETDIDDWSSHSGLRATDVDSSDPYPFEQRESEDGSGPAPAGGVIRPPIRYLIAAAAVAVIAVVLGVVAGGRPLLAVIGWSLGGFGTIGLLTFFTMRDAKRRADPWYVALRGAAQARVVLLALAALGVALNAWHFAHWIARR